MKLRRSTMGIVFIALLASMVGYIVQTTEGFAAPVLEKHGLQRCGVGLPPCLPQRGWEGVRCMNGWCRSDSTEGK